MCCIELESQIGRKFKFIWDFFMRNFKRIFFETIFLLDVRNKNDNNESIFLQI